jgi:hypothetical protein
MWFGVGFMLPQKTDRGGHPFPPIIPKIIAENNDFVLAENGDSLVPESN